MLVVKETNGWRFSTRRFHNTVDGLTQVIILLTCPSALMAVPCSSTKMAFAQLPETLILKIQSGGTHMAVQIVVQDDQYILNHCTKYLARANFDQLDSNNMSASISESWRFPVIDSYSDGTHVQESSQYNTVTFIHAQQGDSRPQDVAVIGTFADLYDPIPLRRIKFLDTDTRYYAVSVVVPKGEAHNYLFLIDGQTKPDPINPQRVVLDNGNTWSRFFTDGCTQPMSLERSEMNLLCRFTEHILPFRTAEGENFLKRYYNNQDLQTKQRQYAPVYRLDESVGEINFIDNLLARHERHHLIDYKICLRLIDKLLRARNPYIEPSKMDKEAFIELFNEMATNQEVEGWDYSQYSNPRYFLQLLRRHVYTGAFSHPKYGGNVGATGWAYLEERYQDANGQTLFNWRRAIENPLGANTDYHG